MPSRLSRGSKRERRPIPLSGGGLTVILKATDRCNCACTFCSVGPAGRTVISWTQFEKLARELEKLVRHRNLERLQFVFHGGEPTLLGASFLEKACRRIERLPVQTSASISGFRTNNLS